MAKLRFQLKIEDSVATYFKRFIQIYERSDIPDAVRHLIVGSFLYLLDDEDLIPDDTPNIGLLDDLAVFIQVADHLVEMQSDLSAVIPIEEIQKDLKFLQENEAMLFKTLKVSLEAIQRKGSGKNDLAELRERLKEKYLNLGKDGE